MIGYPGTRWYKCDFHLHSAASECFEDKTVTPEQWVARAIEQGLDCVAVTDHDTDAGIDDIIAAANDLPLTVFPGVEITCDSSKVHLLVIFDKDKRAQDVGDFLIECGIKREDFGGKDTHSSLRIRDIIEKARAADCLVIPAHVDQFSGLCEVSYATIQDVYKIPDINAVQITHQEFLHENLQIAGNGELQTAVSGHYSDEINEETLKRWFSPVKLAQDGHKALLVFSDNPQSSTSTKHGIEGIGEKFTWIKMEEAPSLESLRQAFLLPSLRVRNCFECPDTPYAIPELWIRHIAINNTEVTANDEPLLVEFNPQLNTIIGGRGSGKSGILRFIRGVFNKTSDMADDIKKDHDAFYKKADKGVGVFGDDSKVEIIVERQGKLYRLTATNIRNSIDQDIEIQKYDDGGGWIEVTSEGFIDFFEFEQYSQKQIYDIAQKPHYLRERIDAAVDGMDSLVNEKETLARQYLEISTQIRTAESKLDGKGKLETELGDLAERIKIFDESAISTLLSANKKFQKEEKLITAPVDELEERIQSLEELIPEIAIPENDFSEISDDYRDEIKTAYQSSRAAMAEITEKITSSHSDVKKVLEDYKAAISKTKWHVDFNTNKEEFETKKLDLLEQGVDEIDNYEKLSSAKEVKEKAVEELSGLDRQLIDLKSDRDKILGYYIAKLEEISQERRLFVREILEGENVQISIKGFRDQDSFELQFRNIIDREAGFQNDIDILSEKIFQGKVTDTMKEYRSIILDLNKGAEDTDFSGHFRNRIKNLSPEVIDRLMLLMPEDEIAIKYKPSGSSGFKPLATASAGQKTTAILTFIMSHGQCPLILDQPEDDLDNRLVYELIVDRLKNAKEKRQVIVVTHNANIPVNGDAEYVISMDSNTKHFNVFASGSVDQQTVKKEICDVMEGTEYAFNMRAKRYQGLST